MLPDGHLAGVDEPFVSPHLDDVVFSCGATVAARVDSGARVCVVTVFSGTPRGLSLSTYARDVITLTGPTDVEGYWAMRKAEDRAAIALLGAETFWLDRFDARSLCA